MIFHIAQVERYRMVEDQEPIDDQNVKQSVVLDDLVEVALILDTAHHLISVVVALMLFAVEILLEEILVLNAVDEGA